MSRHRRTTWTPAAVTVLIVPAALAVGGLVGLYVGFALLTEDPPLTLTRGVVFVAFIAVALATARNVRLLVRAYRRPR